MDSDLEKINDEIAEKSISDSEVSDEEKADTIDEDVFDPKTFGTKRMANDGSPLDSIAEEDEDDAGPVIKDKGLSAFMAKDKVEKDKKKKEKRRGKRKPLRPFQAPARIVDCTSDTAFEKAKLMPIWPANHPSRRWPSTEE